MFLHQPQPCLHISFKLPLALLAIPSIMPGVATREAISLFLVVLLLIIKRCSVLLFELLLEFLFVGILRIFLHHMGTRTSLNNFLAVDIISSRLLFNI